MKLTNLMFGLAALLTLPALAFAQANRTQPTSNELQVKAVVTLLNEVKVPARDQGVLRSIDVEEGAEVEKDTVLAQLDDTEAKFKFLGATAEVNVANAKAKSDAAVKVSIKQAAAAKANWEATFKLWQKGTVADFQERKDKVDWERSEAQIEVSRVEHDVDKLTVLVKQAGADAAKNEFSRRQITLTEDWKGIVMERMKSPGEWVQPGDTIMRIARMDRLRVEGHVPAGTVSPRELRGRAATVSVRLDATNRLEVAGNIKFASPEIDTRNTFRIIVEIDNPIVGDDWGVQPGQFADIIIPLDRAVPVTTVRKVGVK